MGITVMISVNCDLVGGVMTLKFTLKIKSKSGKLFTIECHFPTKLTNFGTMPVGLLRPLARG